MRLVIGVTRVLRGRLRVVGSCSRVLWGRRGLAVAGDNHRSLNGVKDNTLHDMERIDVRSNVTSDRKRDGEDHAMLFRTAVKEGNVSVACVHFSSLYEREGIEQVEASKTALDTSTLRDFLTLLQSAPITKEISRTIRHVLKALWTHGSPWSIQDYKLLVEHAGSTFSDTKALEWVDAMLGSDMIPDVDMLVLAIQRVGSASKLEGLVRLYTGFKERGLLLPKLNEMLVDACLYRYGPKEALRILEDVEREGPLPAWAVAQKIKAFGQLGDVSAVESAFETYVASGEVPSEEMYRQVLIAVGRHGTHDQLQTYFHDMTARGVPQTPDIHGALIEAYVFQDNILAAERHMSSLASLNVIPTVYAYTSLIEAHFRLGNLPAAETLLKDLRSKNLVPTPKLLNSCLAAYMKQNNLSSALDIIQEYQSLGYKDKLGHFRTTWINSLIRTGQTEQAQTLYTQLLDSKNGTPDPVILSMLVDACIRTKNYTKALSIAEWANKHSEFIDPVLTSTLIHAFTKSGDMQTALRLLRRLTLDPSSRTHPKLVKTSRSPFHRHPPLLVAYSTIISALCRLNAPHLAINHLTQLAKEFTPNSIVVTPLLRYYARTRDRYSALDVLQTLLSHDVLPDIGSLKVVYDLYVHLYPTETIQYYIKDLRRLSLHPLFLSRAFGAAIANHIAFGEYELAEWIFLEMQSEGVVVLDETLFGLVGMYREIGEVEKGEVLLGGLKGGMGFLDD
ncbi:pentatricopeptide repeat domain-containing protein [Spizellomyces punctatus DAOM BR117]|uniref:Pentatricopeptide repeat domain-containing protein n=1 Tax=Spizellomyces punctatus (strain DAOM BR117) TaxID=645134 RepID=A0A0L0HPA7_SPIPD|nr:pentatricopeptide repeat domain-containing protein [Spizellomyces punctatus DAOM BR117]KND02927.1 pentatricopeptide repeat domain-containing protein [Spizellomyces punctatus DAOM BR117]|eukprot:XP_016610966.1 pentatricopeptide repeat domain-containing protein [Spizellomyces punctatus DAOM BR117]